MQFEQAKTFILDKLKNELPEHLTYHGVHHVLDVYTAAENIAGRENVNEHEVKLLLTAALFHDSGFINEAKGHEEYSCGIANQYLPQFDYSAADIKAIDGMIMATRIPQLPQNRLEEIISDADLDYLGRDDFFSTGHTLFLEFKETGIIKDEVEWNKLQVKFMENHHYFTKTSQKLRGPKKQKNLKLVKAKVK